MARENKQAKARRLLAEGRLTVGWIDDHKILAVCQGDSGMVYKVTYGIHEGYRCDCEARGECSHEIALKLVCISPVVMMRRAQRPDPYADQFLEGSAAS